MLLIYLYLSIHAGVLVHLSTNPLVGGEVTTSSDVVIPLTSGLLYTSTCWGVDRAGNSLAPPVKTEHTRSVTR